MEKQQLTCGSVGSGRGEKVALTRRLNRHNAARRPTRWNRSVERTGLQSRSVISLSRQLHCKVVVAAHWVFLMPFTVPGQCSLEDQTLPASQWLAVASCPHSFCGTSQAVGWERREGGREFPGHLLAPVTYYLPQLEQRPSPAPSLLVVTTLPLIPMFVL